MPTPAEAEYTNPVADVRTGSAFLSALPASLADAPLERVGLWGTGLCDGETPLLDAAFDDLVAASVISCCLRPLAGIGGRDELGCSPTRRLGGGPR